MTLWTGIILAVAEPFLTNPAMKLSSLSASVILAATAVIIFLRTLYKLWMIVQPQSISPKRAVLFLFIPLFNVYWSFVSIHDLTTHINDYAKDNGLKSRIDSRLTLTYCISFIFTLIPFVSIPLQIAILIMSSLIMHQWNGVIEEAAL